jgi:hypothetical protein
VTFGAPVDMFISGPKNILKPGQTTNIKAQAAIFLSITHKNTLRRRPEARAAARATWTLGPPLDMFYNRLVRFITCVT